MAIPFFLSGSTSDDFDQTDDITNPLPPCPDSPNCVRLSQKLSSDADKVFKYAKKVLQDIGAVKINTTEEKRHLESVFKVFIYKDNFFVQVEKVGDSDSILHLRSSSRVGYSDLGVNRRRVKKFLRKLDKEL